MFSYVEEGARGETENHLSRMMHLPCPSYTLLCEIHVVTLMKSTKMNRSCCVNLLPQPEAGSRKPSYRYVK